MYAKTEDLRPELAVADIEDADTVDGFAVNAGNGLTVAPRRAVEAQAGETGKAGGLQ